MRSSLVPYKSVMENLSHDYLIFRFSWKDLSVGLGDSLAPQPRDGTGKGTALQLRTAGA